ncbi:anthranilate synthase component II [Bifidobacterium tsurumiense]|uniref:anthranilate synthase component II n=1 Tax=Bifidobacterium tsurumiense TaxID=356829 RepID=UPI0012B21224|nr:aminodeoxychorismate/anthranilate synthase component II [Bifidobacterium tsurumiense]MDY4678416.1 aminodeoxychorismate/anthranilate synthase component II [Bifidobacterium tsurumiense]MSS12639.1 aminodeoxychorismate/anthranilate synthase component II [Bifidobacterium tsurumiense]
MTDSARILVVDNYDSFVYTIVGYLATLGADVTVIRNDAADVVEALRRGDTGILDEYDGVLISPGPGAPAESGISEDMIRLCAKVKKPMFGVCLGLQALAEVYGADVRHAPTIMHGKTSLIDHEKGGVFEGVANPVTATRYHSLSIQPDTMPQELVITARAQSDDTIQGIRHRDLPLYAVQFHPESVMTEDGYRLLANWLAVCGQTNAVANSEGLQPKVAVQ